MDSNHWQLCPKCNGTGTTLPYGFSGMNTSAVCDVCYGQKIISILTGRPPQSFSVSHGTTTGPIELPNVKESDTTESQ